MFNSCVWKDNIFTSSHKNVFHINASYSRKCYMAGVTSRCLSKISNKRVDYLCQSVIFNVPPVHSFLVLVQTNRFHVISGLMLVEKMAPSTFRHLPDISNRSTWEDHWTRFWKWSDNTWSERFRYANKVKL